MYKFCGKLPNGNAFFAPSPDSFPDTVTLYFEYNKELPNESGVIKTDGVSKVWVEPFPKDASSVEPTPEARAAKLAELSTASHAAIVAGCDVVLSGGSTAHFTLAETDQINLTAAVAAVEQGAAGYPYHADGQLCRLFSAVDILSIAHAATAHKLYHTTYCNHLLMWARRARTVGELEGITYGAALPADLAANLEGVLEDAGGV